MFDPGAAGHAGRSLAGRRRGLPAPLPELDALSAVPPSLPGQSARELPDRPRVLGWVRVRRLPTRGRVSTVSKGGRPRRQILKAGAGAAGLALAAPVLRLAAQDAGAERLADDLFLVRIPGETNVIAQSTG